ncbi:MAG: hypothetical protein LBB55_00305, partial [Zoogloeaceae bacterium]|nr:hypothetical protein [Zoogloeaceae bacterium]
MRSIANQRNQRTAAQAPVMNECRITPSAHPTYQWVPPLWIAPFDCCGIVCVANLGLSSKLFQGGNMMRWKTFFAVLCVSLLMAACGDKNEGKAPEATAPAAPQAATPTTAAPQAPSVPTPEPEAAPAPDESSAAPAAFDIEKIPVSNTPLGEFPFFTPPEGHKYVKGSANSA